MNIFQKISSVKKINELAETLEAYYLRIEKYYKQNFFYSTWVYHLKKDEIESLGLKKPFGCCYLNIQGEPNFYFKRREEEYNEIIKRNPYAFKPLPVIGITAKQIEKEKERRRIYEEECEQRQKLIAPAEEWAKTIGARTVLVFKMNTAQQYMQMIQDVAIILSEYKKLYFCVYGEKPEWKNSTWYIEQRIKELESTYYIIERNKQY